MTKEHELIERYFAPLSGGVASGAFGLLDDVGVMSPFPHGFDRLATVDTLVAGVHFFADDAPEDIAWKALAVNVSDIVAKGGAPADYLLALSLPETGAYGDDWLAAFAKGLQEAQTHFRCMLLGGDTVRTPGPLGISITLLGVAPVTQMVRRQGAKSGDLVYVSGHIGDAALGLLLRQGDERLQAAALDEAQRQALLQAYLRPQPSLALGQIIRPLASASMDISDGLAGDFARLCAASCVGGVIDSAALPLSPAATAALAASPDLLNTVLCGGDDYQLLFTVSPQQAEELEKTAASRGQKVSRIGGIVSASAGVKVLDADGEPLDLAKAAYDHFA